MDREQVIKGLESVYRCVSPVSHTCGECPYQDNHVECKRRVLRDAIALLKEQEPVEPKKSALSMNNDFMWVIWDCGHCGSQLRSDANYCDQCGKKVKWE